MINFILCILYILPCFLIGMSCMLNSFVQIPTSQIKFRELTSALVYFMAFQWCMTTGIAWMQIYSTATTEEVFELLLNIELIGFLVLIALRSTITISYAEGGNKKKITLKVIAVIVITALILLVSEEIMIELCHVLIDVGESILNQEGLANKISGFLLMYSSGLFSCLGFKKIASIFYSQEWDKE